MATSSIFHNVKITDPKKAEAFVAAIEASEKEKAQTKPKVVFSVNTNRELSRQLAEKRKLARGK